MKPYIRPEILATYAVEELLEEATVCVAYGPHESLPNPAETEANSGLLSLNARSAASTGGAADSARSRLTAMRATPPRRSSALH
jgi:hypothetical protein